MQGGYNMTSLLLDSVINTAWKRSEGKCECSSTDHDHKWRCCKVLYLPHRGLDEFGGWELYYKDKSARLNDPNNCEIQCFACYREKSKLR